MSVRNSAARARQSVDLALQGWGTSGVFTCGTLVDDLLLVQINPHLRESVPTTARDLLDCMNEVAFNTSLLKALRSKTAARGSFLSRLRRFGREAAGHSLDIPGTGLRRRSTVDLEQESIE